MAWIFHLFWPSLWVNCLCGKPKESQIEQFETVRVKASRQKYKGLYGSRTKDIQYDTRPNWAITSFKLKLPPIFLVTTFAMVDSMVVTSRNGNSFLCFSAFFSQFLPVSRRTRQQSGGCWVGAYQSTRTRSSPFVWWRYSASRGLHAHRFPFKIASQEPSFIALRSPIESCFPKLGIN